MITPGTSVEAIIEADANGNPGLFTNEPIFTVNAIIPKGIKLPVDLVTPKMNEPDADERMVVTTAMEPFTLYVTVSLYAALAVSLPFFVVADLGIYFACAV